MKRVPKGHSPRSAHRKRAYIRTPEKQQERRNLHCTKEARASRKEEKTVELQLFEEKEDLLYGPGIAD
ncbi:hypothetical protein ANTRET_LOCUS9546 [Anthophora retusa]